MAYDLGPLVARTSKSAILENRRSRLRFAGWQRLAPDSRLEVVERALSAPAKDMIDFYPIAL